MIRHERHVDHASADDSADFVRERFPQVRVLQMERNLLFAEGNNRGAAEARGRLIATVNQDTVCHQRWLSELMRTVEAHRDVYEKEIDAFSTMFTIISMKKIGTSAVQSRACAGVANGTYMFALPGSPGACKDGWDDILVHQLDYRHPPCNFVEIMPRLDEHKRRK